MTESGKDSFGGRDVPLRKEWYVAAESREVSTRPLHRLIVGVPAVVYRAGGAVRAFVDRCPHRNVPLSDGRCDSDGHIECPYHGWKFDPEGRCVEIPGLTGTLDREHRLESLPVREEAGFVWVCPTQDCRPSREPFEVPHLGDAAFTTVVRQVVSPGSVHATAENALDVPHTAVLHRGLFRGAGKKNRIRAIVSRYSDWVESEYLGEPPPRGVVARLLGARGEGLTVEHWDRFFLPSVLQVEYRLGERSHFVITGLLTPEERRQTRIYAVASFRTPMTGGRLRGRAFATLLEPLARMVFAQDSRVLRAQSETIERFGRDRFTSTEIDTLGPAVWRLLRTAHKAEQAGAGVGAREEEPSRSSGEMSPDAVSRAGVHRLPRREPGTPLKVTEVELDA